MSDKIDLTQKRNWDVVDWLIFLFFIYRWEVVGSGSGIQYGPFPVPLGGLAARFWKTTST